MSFRSGKWLRRARLFSLSAMLAVFPAVVRAEPVPLERAIRLALSHSTTTAIADSDVQRAIANYHELRSNMIPSLTVGSGLGWSYGFPLTIEGAAPSLATVTAQSSVFNMAQNQYLGAAKADIRGAQFQSKDQREAVIQDVVVSYAELTKWEARLIRLGQDQGQTQQIEKAVGERVQEGVDSATDLNKAKLANARVRLHMAEARGSCDVLRKHLADLTGVPVASFEIVSESIPAFPPMSREDDSESKAVASSPAIKFADQRALAESMRARAEHRAVVFPTLDFSAQYARLSTFNNYQDFYVRFRPDDATIGVAIRIPLFNAIQRARAKEADFVAVRAKKQAEAARNQVSEEALKLERVAEQLEAARDVAQLEYELAESARQSAETRIQSQTGTYHELADAQVQANERYLLFQDADFEYQRARLNLLRATGELEKWALPGTPSK